jgi:hypothetical protein
VFVRNLDRASRTAGLTTGVAACSLTTFSLTMASALPLLAWCEWRYRQGWRATLVVPLSTALLLMLPHFVYVWERKGDPFISDVLAGVFYRNYEFVLIKKTGCDGCPSREEMDKSSYAGRPTSVRHYIFGMHSLSEVAGRVVTGYRELYISGELRRDWLGFFPGRRIRWVYWAGLVVLGFAPYRELLLWPVFTINLLAFIIPLGIDPRLVMHTAVFGSFVTALPVWWGARAIVAALASITPSMSWPERSRSLFRPWSGG